MAEEDTREGIGEELPGDQSLDTEEPIVEEVKQVVEPEEK